MDRRQSDKYSSPPKNVIVIGGSLSGLMHGLMLHRLGSTVRILEQSPADTPRFDRVSEIPLGIASVQLQSLDQKGKVHPFLRVNRIMSSWDALYFRLRANFDMRASDYVPYPRALEPPLADEDGEAAQLRARYEVGKQVVGVEHLETGQVTVRYKDLADGGKDGEALADLVIGADGPNSVVRRTFLEPGQAERMYSGYVAWRGVVPETQVTKETRDVFRANITYSILKGEGGHVIVYNIPGAGGSIEPGERVLNFCWYTNVPLSSLDEIMTDVDGKRHHTNLPPGKVRAAVWEKQKAYAKMLFARPYLEVIEKINLPFLHQITDYCSPRASFARGRVIIVGDALTLLRPHIAFSTNQAAYHTLLTERLVTGELTAEEWEYQVTTAAYLHWRRSVWFGEYFQRPLYVSIKSAVLFWAISTLVRVKIWVGWLQEQAT
uniref:BisA n=1 Tax=Biscogniauxia sp. TaxID=1896107 RepID=A0A6M4EK64_9PEZI|nr:BisA [Biscogniauxia sp.]